MMDVDEGCVPTARHLATPAVASLHGAPARGRDALGRALRFLAQDEMGWLATGKPLARGSIGCFRGRSTLKVGRPSP